MAKRKQSISPKQVDRIRQLSQQRLSTNQIQKTLSREGLGLRRQTMLRCIREFRHQQTKANASVYTPIKYRYQFVSSGKKVAGYGTQGGVSKRVEICGDGKNLYKAMQIVAKHPPKDEYAILRINARELLNNPRKYLDKGVWDARPKVRS